MIGIEQKIAAAVHLQPLRHAGLVHDLIADRSQAVHRDLNPQIFKRHQEFIEAHLEELGFHRHDQNLTENQVQEAVSHLISHTMNEMCNQGIAQRREMGKVTLGRTLFAAHMIFSRRQ